jgi:Animal haem peroxidase
VGGVARSDVPRNSQRTALLGDPRNDENLVVSQLQRALLGFHNRVLDDVRDDLGPTVTAQELFAEAQRTVRWHYQWLVIHEFLVTTVGADVVDDVLAHGPAHFRWRNHPYTPVAFSVAANRFGHSQVPPELPRELRHQRERSAAAVLRPDLRSLGDRSRRSRRPARGPPRPAPLHRLADVFDFGDGRVRRIGLILGDPQSYLRQDPDWTPSYGTGDDFSIADLLRAAGVVAALP